MDKVINEYSLFDKIRLAVWVLRSRLISRKIRIIRFPIDIREGSISILEKALLQEEIAEWMC